MAATEDFIALIEELLVGLGPVTTKRMFGGAGVFADGVMIGLIADDTLYLKADAATQAVFEAEGLSPFVYTGKSRPIAMSYWRVPDRLYDSPEELCVWARDALIVARRADAKRMTSTRPGGSRR
ncbi:MAG: hypothetical protein C0511_18705 [Hyphomicrobium sp.]|mgnify:FL=1|nr:hypothetical protein [Hyphomicrobium sp.]